MNIIRIPRQAIPSADLNLGGTSTTEKVFSDAAATPAAIVLPLPSAGELAGAGLPKMSIFKVFAAGRVTGGTTTNWTTQLQYGTSLTTSSNTDLESGAAVAVNSVSGQWIIDATLMLDNTSGKLDGYCTHMISGSTVTLTAAAKFDNTVTGVDPDASGTLGFVVTGTFSSGNAANVAFLDVFNLQLIGQGG